MRSLLALFLWAYGVWLLLTWTATAEQLIFGGCLAVIVALLLAPLGAVAGPWRLLDPRRMVGLLWLFATVLVRIVKANVELAYRIWAPSRPLTSGMIVVPTQAHTDAQLTATGLLTSIIVDNQIVDLDRAAAAMQYHAVAVPEGSPAERAEKINRPVERPLAVVDRRS